MENQALATKARFLHLTGETHTTPEGHIFVGDFFKNDVLFRCRGLSGLLDGGKDFAIQDNGHVEYWHNGLLSRPLEEGPAVLSLFGDYAEFWLDGKRIR